MKKFFKTVISIFLLLVLSACIKIEQEQQSDLLDSIKENKKFVVGINDDSRPFGYIDSQTGQITGFDADLMREICKYLFKTDRILKFSKVTPSNRIYKLNSKDVDVVISTMTITQERLQVVDFSSPYFMTGQAILVKQDSKIKRGKDLDDKKVGIVLGTTAADNIKFIAPNVIMVGFKNYKDAFEELKAGNIDAMSTDDVILQGIIMQNSKYRILPDRYSTEFYGIALRKDNESKRLKNEINDALIFLEKNGTIKKLEQEYNVHYRR